MKKIIGLGNPGEKYKTTRHNIGRIILSSWQKQEDLSSFKRIAKLNALTTKGSGFVLALPLCDGPASPGCSDCCRSPEPRRRARSAPALPVRHDLRGPPRGGGEGRQGRQHEGQPGRARPRTDAGHPHPRPLTPTPRPSPWRPCRPM